MPLKPGAITTKEAALALLKFDSRLDDLVKEGMENGLNYAAGVAATEYMEGGSRTFGFVGLDGGGVAAIGDPPNPPPGPLKIRTGKLRRGIKVVKPRKKGMAFIGGLSNNVPYAAIHEFGGKTAGHFIAARKADKLAFPGRDGNMVFREVVFHPGSKIPARPYLTPAIEDSEEFVDKEITESMIRGIEEALDAGGRF
jgi:phage gpG-like protein